MSIVHAQTIQGWKNREITAVSIMLVDKGCAGKKVSVEEGKKDGFILLETLDGVEIFIDPLYEGFLRTARITPVGTKWILASESVNTRCGCGSSFSLKSESPLMDKIARTKLALKQKKEGVHH